MEFLDLGQVPVFCNVQWSSREEALAAAKGPLELLACLECGHAFNVAFEAERLAYAPGYENSQHVSSVFRAYAERLVDRLIGRYGVRRRSVVDIGCGRGDLLALLCERGENEGFGFDPSFAGSAEDSVGGNFTIRREYFGPDHAAAIRPALVCCRHVLEHVEQPVTFLRNLRSALEVCGDAVLYIEVPSGEELLSSLGLWDYLYEHVSYFSEASLATVLTEAGFQVLEIYRDFGGQFLCADVEIRGSASGTRRPGRRPLEAISESMLRAASRDLSRRLQTWRVWTEGLARRRSTVAIWGAGSKGVMFLNLLGLAAPGPIDAVVDQNPVKHGRFVSGTGQIVVAPESLENSSIEQIVIMNGIYRDEVKARLESIGRSPELTIAWP